MKNLGEMFLIGGASFWATFGHHWAIFCLEYLVTLKETLEREESEETLTPKF
jgi:hypothetical protein